MASTEHTETINASADAVWAVTDWLGAKKLALATTVEKMDIDGDEIGSIRTVYFKNGTIVRSQLEERDIENKYYRYRMIDTGDFPFTEYMNQIWVTPLGPDSCEIKCQVTLTPREGVPEQDCLDSWVDNIKESSAQLQELAGAS